MNIIKTRFGALVSSIMLIAGMQAPTAQALDTDVYLKAKDVGNTEQPNVLFVLDTSGSMSSTAQSAPQYNSGIDYCTDDLDALTGVANANTGKPANCALYAGRIYWSSSGTPTSLTSNQWFDAPSNNPNVKNKCLASYNQLGTGGIYGPTNIARWKQNVTNWNTFTGISNTDIQYVDCRSDGRRDGLVSGDSLQPQNSSATAYTSSNGSAFSWNNYNGVYTLYTPNYLNYYYNSVLASTPTLSRIQAAQNAINAIIDANDSIRFGLMVFNRNSSGQDGGRVIFKIDDMTAARKTSMTSTVNSTVASGNTPLAETMWEAYRYLKGLSVQFGDDDTAANPKRDLTAETGGTATVGGTYITPIQFSCQATYIIYVTDGDPTSDSAADASIKSLAGLSGSTCAHSDSNPQNSCLKDLAGWMHTHDISPVSGNQTVTTHTVGFGTGISAGGAALLNTTATMGGGAYKTATSSTELLAVIQGALTEVLSKPTSATAPSLSVNAFNRLYNLEDIYLALFKPSNSCAWPGNIKKYRVCRQADIDSGLCSNLSDVIDSVPSLATDNGYIKNTSISYWSSTKKGGAGLDKSDGAEVTSAGVGIQMPAPSARVIYTYQGSYTGLSSSAPAPTDKIEVPSSGTPPFYTYVKADPTRLGLPSGSTTTDVNNFIGWIRGSDTYNKWTYVPTPATDPKAPKYDDTPTAIGNSADNGRRWAFGDVVHSRPVAVTFGCNGSIVNGDCANPILKLFVGTNDGMVHMLRNDTGEVQWSFMPQEMYGMQYQLSQAADSAHLYGIDNTPSFWVTDNNKDGIIDPAAGDKVYMYISMRRGGRNIYAFDVTPSSKLTSDGQNSIVPKLVWTIQGGTGSFTELAQTWSRPLVTRVRVKCNVASCSDNDSTTLDSTTRVVLMFGGGYDTNQDNNVAPGPDGVGRAIYMVDPANGALLWSAGKTATGAQNLPLTKMNFGIPSELGLLDTDGDGATDRIYVGDTGGQLWRIDLSNQLDPGISNGGTTAYVFADIGCANEAVNSTTMGSTYVHDTSGTCSGGVTSQGRRRFFYPPAVAPVKDAAFSTNPNYDAVTVGSGNREDPLDFLTDEAATGSKEAVHNRVYVFRDYNYVTGSPATIPTSPLSEAGLYDATANLLGTSTGAALTAEINNIKTKSGWYVEFRESTTIAMPNGLTTRWVGEKVLASTTIESGVVKVTTYTPANSVNTQGANNNGACNAKEGIAKLYAMNLLNAAAAIDFDGDGNPDRVTILGGGIPSETVRIFLPEGNTSIVQSGGGVMAGGKDDKSGGIKRNSWQGCYGSPSGDTQLCGE